MKLLESAVSSQLSHRSEASGEVPSLSQICEAVVVRNLHRFDDVSPLSVTDLVAIILKARVDRDPDLVLRFEQSVPGLVEDETLDEQYWQHVVENMFPSRKIRAPFQASKAEVAALVHEIPSASTSRLQEILPALRKMAISVPLLSETGVGKAVKGLGKHENSWVARNAKMITTQWRAIIDRVRGKEVGTPEGLTDNQFNDEVKLAERAPEARTWREVFLACKQLEQEKLQWFGKRSREQAHEIQAAKRRVQEGDEQLNALAQHQLSSTPPRQSSASVAPTPPGPGSVRAKYMREAGHERSKDAGKRTKLIPASRPIPAHLKSTSAHRVVKTASGAVMKIPRAFDAQRRTR